MCRGARQGTRLLVMRVHIAADHAGFELKSFLVSKLNEAGYEVIDHGAETYDELDQKANQLASCCFS